LFSHHGYDAVEVVKGCLPDGFDVAHQIKRAPAFYQSSDNIDPDQPTKHSLLGYAGRYTMFSMDVICLEALRQCFADPEVRIRLMHEYEDKAWPYITRMKIGNDGFLANQSLDFNPGLNCIIGGKGVGKSLAVEALRFALNQASEDKDIVKDHIGKLDTRLKAMNTVEVDLATPTAKYSLICTYEGNGKATRRCINLTTGEEYVGDVSQLFRVLAYSQTEVIKIAEDEKAQLRLADALIDSQSLQMRISELQEVLSKNDNDIVSALEAKIKSDELLTQIAYWEERRTNIDKTLSSSLISDWRNAENKQQTFDRQLSYIQSLDDVANRFDTSMKEIGLPTMNASLAGEPDLLAGQNLLTDLAQEILKRVVEIKDLISRKQAAVTELRDSWQSTFHTIRDAYQNTLQGTNQGALEAERRDLVKNINDAVLKVDRYRKLVDTLPGLMNDRDAYLDQLESTYRAYYEKRKAKFDELTVASENKLKLSLRHADNRTAYVQALSELLKGTGPNAIPVPTRQKIADKVSPRELINLVLAQDANKLAEQAEISQEMASRTITRMRSTSDFVDTLAIQHCYYPEDSPEIFFNKSNSGVDFARIDEVSVGQKCTALLIIALCDGAVPIVIDQPEDALDIASVWNDVARKIRRGKRSRQFILTTHNSSVAVGGDSDNFLVIEPAGKDRAKVKIKGAIENKEVQPAVIAHLEGGPDAYLLKQNKLNVRK
jgi:hypothetical protein